jgi:hypothetical protein
LVLHRGVQSKVFLWVGLSSCLHVCSCAWSSVLPFFGSGHSHPPPSSSPSLPYGFVSCRQSSNSSLLPQPTQSRQPSSHSRAISSPQTKAWIPLCWPSFCCWPSPTTLTWAAQWTPLNDHAPWARPLNPHQDHSNQSPGAAGLAQLKADWWISSLPYPVHTRQLQQSLSHGQTGPGCIIWVSG